MRFPSENGIADIAEVRDLNIIEENAVLQFAGIADNRMLTYNGGAADECTMADLRAGVDDRIWRDVRVRRDVCTPCYINMVWKMAVLELWQRGANG